MSDQMWAAPLKDFSEDKLNLKSFADDLTSIVVSPFSTPTNEYSKVIALDSGWGTGKTSFINMWKSKLESTDPRFICLKYDAWENDDSLDALVPILCSFEQLIDSDDKKTELMKRELMKLLKMAISVSVGISIFGFLTVNVTGNIKKKSPDTILKEFSARREHKKRLKELIGSIRGEHNYLLIFIDELDRCRPTFAIETLEVVKHFFDISQVVFVFSLDMNQLQKSIKTIYGDIDSMGYLQRFFDYRISLPKRELNSFLNDRREKLDPPHTDYEKKLCKCEITWLSMIAGQYSISLRALNNICVMYTKFKAYARSNFNWEKRWKGAGPRIINDLEEDKYGEWYYFKTYLTFIAMKYFCPNEYWSFIKNGSNFDDLGKNNFDDLWYMIFGGKYTTDSSKTGTVSSRSCYTKEIAGLTPREFLHESIYHFLVPNPSQTYYRLVVGSEIDMDEYRELPFPDFIDRIIEDALLESKHPRAN